MADFIGFELIGNKELARKLERFPDIVQDDAIDALTVYLIKVWQLYPPRKSVTRKQAYGRTFKTDKSGGGFFGGSGLFYFTSSHFTAGRSISAIRGNRSARVGNQLLSMTLIIAFLLWATKTSRLT